MPHLAIYTGSFDPITLGHLDVLDRSRGLFDEVILAIGVNPNKPPLFSVDARAAGGRPGSRRSCAASAT